MSTEVRPAHSPLGASGAERWLNCCGSVSLLKDLQLPESDEPEYRSEGTAVHAALAKCFETGCDAWETVGVAFGDTKPVVITSEMADAMQIFLDECRAHEVEGASHYTEFSIDAPDFHKDFYGTLDRGSIIGNHMVIRDYKNGAGIVVEVEENPQIMYYAYGLLRRHPEVTTVSLGIVQPNAFHPDGPIRVWGTTAEHIIDWAENTLKPAMLRTAIEKDFNAGDWCRFCPAKLVCPLMVSLYGAAMQYDPKLITKLSDEQADRDYKYLKALEHYIRAKKEDILARLKKGAVMQSCKLVPQKANRVFRTEVDLSDGTKKPIVDFVRETFGEEGFVPSEMKTPAQLEKLSPDAQKFVHEYAYTPQTGQVTVAPMNDKRPAVKVQTTAEAFPQAQQMAVDAAASEE